MSRMNVGRLSLRAVRCFSLPLACSVALIAGLGHPQAAAAATVGTISADYDVTSGDNTTFHFQNTSAFNFTNIVLSGLGISGSINGHTGTKNLANIIAGGSSIFSFPDATGVFASDFDDVNSGAARYTFTALWNGSNVSGVFSPAVNASGGFVAFLGNDSAGNETDATIHSTKVADITTTATVTPEPGSLALLATGGLPLLGFLRRRRA